MSDERIPIHTAVHEVTASRLAIDPSAATRGCQFCGEDVPVGRELDALVAERVMGSTVDDWDHVFLPVASGLLNAKGTRATCDGSCLRCGDAAPSDAPCFPRYSTDIAAAWEVVEKLSSPVPPFAPDDEMYYEVSVYRNPVGTWTCHLPFHTREAWGHGDSAPEAICRAALSWAEAKK